MAFDLVSKAVKLLRLPTVDYSNAPIKIIPAQTGDSNSRYIVIELYDDRGTVDLSKYQTGRLYVTLPDSETVIYSEGEINTNKNTLTVKIEGTMLQESGKISANVVFSDGSNDTALTSQTFYIYSHRSQASNEALLGEGVIGLINNKRLLELPLKKGEAIGSLQQLNYEDGSEKNSKATGFGAVVFGGFRGDKPNGRPDNEDTITTAEGIQSFAVGAGCHAYGNWSIAIGKDSKAYQQTGIAIGGKVQAGMTEEEFLQKFPSGLDDSGRPYSTSYSNATAFGSSNKALAKNSSAFGEQNIVDGKTSVAFGQLNTISKSAPLAFVTGYGNRIGISNGSVQGGSGAAVFGNNNTVLGNRTTVFGADNVIQPGTTNALVSGDGLNTYLSDGIYGTNTLKGLFGTYNAFLSDYDIFVIGNGTGSENRSNAFQVLRDGRAKVYGAPVDKNDVVRKEELDDAISTILGSDELNETLDTIKEIQDVILSDDRIEGTNTGVIGTLIDHQNKIYGRLNLHDGVGAGSVQQLTYKISEKNPKATGLGAFALGGFRGDKPDGTPNTEDTTTTAEGIQAFAFGAGNHAYGNWSVAGGKDSSAYQQVSFAFGGKVQAGMTESEFNEMYPAGVDSSGRPYATSYSYAIALGDTAKALGRGSVSIGRNLKNKGNYSVLCGDNNNSDAQVSFTCGAGNLVTDTAYAAIVGGTANSVAAEKSFVIGSHNSVPYQGFHSLVAGSYNYAQVNDSIVVGLENNVKGSAVIIGGRKNIVGLNNGIVLGEDNSVGIYEQNTRNIFAIGSGLQVSGSFSNRVVIGTYNNDNGNTILQVGNGSNYVRSNAFEVFKDGRAKVYGAPIDDNDVVRKKELNEAVASIIGDGNADRITSLQEKIDTLEAELDKYVKKTDISYSGGVLNFNF